MREKNKTLAAKRDFSQALFCIAKWVYTGIKLFFSSGIPRGNVSPPTCSPRRKLVAAAVVTQVWIYRVDIGDRRSHDGSRQHDCD